ncbi:MAG: tRNA (adenosine(37)-N6)-threonylcarbamoyltransferase complex dimerization subunit type 1 TsaB [Firmicutes bacterium HGW-Firmicutes-12]|jgi:tRNA threonylcarbamoyladenosine biosynthesis protein TsaB|nr:MAG: tRNA (adenosine(37)-N6)-threonylcarbamoyltransferase complex dimerization subunit type 1 TsaB [Firmicutes bacterium HGW-Firmicutes-12]
MLVLGIESSTPVASVAVVSNEGLKGEITLNIGLTHSEQLLPLIDDLFKQCRISMDEICGIAVAGGPGSFTGLRIGMATAKGLAQGLNIPLVSIPTLQALAFTHMSKSGLISPVMNARKKEVYAALFRCSEGKIEQMMPDCAISPQKWADVLHKYNEPVLLTGDGVIAYKDDWQSLLGQQVILLPSILSLNSALTVAWLGQEKLMAGNVDNLYESKPIYIRMSEAEAKLSQCQ